MDEQERRFEDSLFKLVSVAGRYLRVTLGCRGDSCSRTEKTTGAQIYSDRVYLNLNPDDSFEKWVDALIKAEELCGKLENKRIWEKDNPIFIERIAARLRHISDDPV